MLTFIFIVFDLKTVDFYYSQPELTAAALFLAVTGVSPGKRGEDDDNGAVDEDVVDAVVVAG